MREWDSVLESCLREWGLAPIKRCYREYDTILVSFVRNHGASKDYSFTSINLYYYKTYIEIVSKLSINREKCMYLLLVLKCRSAAIRAVAVRLG